jgi:hypothetical protein
MYGTETEVTARPVQYAATEKWKVIKMKQFSCNTFTKHLGFILLNALKSVT